MASPKANTIDIYYTPAPYASQVEHKTVDQGGDIYGGSVGELMPEIEKQDKEMCERWKEEADSYLIFAGLFSAVVVISLVESYKWLSPDPAQETVDGLKETVTQLTQVSQQLFNMSYGMPLATITAENSQPFKRTVLAVMVNVIWFASVVICICCAVFATLIQQTARRYLALTQGCGTPYERARLRRFMFNGLRRFYAFRFFQLLGMSMHLSLLLYCVGLILFVFSIDRDLVSFSIFFLACSLLLYAAVTVLPFFFLDCPYVTPFTSPTWRLYHLLLLGIFSTIRVFAYLPHALLTLGPQTSRPLSWSRRWRKMLKNQVDKRKQRLSDGLQRSVELNAMDATPLERAPTDLVETYSDKEVKDFAAWVPEFFDTYARSGAEGAILPLMSDHPPAHTIFGSRLHHLLSIYVQGSSALTEEQRRRRLRVCLECLWCWAKAFSQNSESLPTYFPLPNPDMIRRLQTEQDPTASMIGRCFIALIAKKLAADVNSRHSSDGRVRDAKLELLSTILGTTRTELETFLSHSSAIDLANIVSLTSSVLKTLFTEEAPPAEVLGIFRATVDILLADDSLTSLDANPPQNLVSSFRNIYSNAQQPQAPDWLSRQLWPISEKFVVRDAQQAGGDITGQV